MKWLREKEVADKLALTPSGLKYLLAREHGFPKPVSISPRHKVYDESAVEKWMRTKMFTDNQEEVDHEQGERVA